MLPSHKDFYKPPEVAKLLSTDNLKIIRWINSGELQAVDVSLHRSKRPRWRISRIDLEAFLSSRSSSPQPEVKRHKKKNDDGVIEFYK
jgi:excisionase family DNA binding protein